MKQIANILGWLGAGCFALCAVPQAYRCWKSGRADGLSPYFLFLWLAGELLYIGGVYLEFGWIWWMMSNYIVNIACLLVLWRYFLWPRDRK